MSCDYQRRQLFTRYAYDLQGELGATVPAGELLELVYDIAINQPLPQTKIDLLSAAAAAAALKQRAALEGIDIHPHGDEMRPEMQVAWQQIALLYRAVKDRSPLPPLTQDAYQSLAFEKLITANGGVTPWNPPMSGAVRLALRRGWASDLAALEATLGNSPVGAEYDPFIGAMTKWLTFDDALPPDLAAAARQFLLLQEADALSDTERGAWMRVVARFASLGIGGEVAGSSGTCTKCGEWAAWSSSHRCDVAAQRQARALVLAVAPLLADPDQAVVQPSSNPRVLAEGLVEPMLAGEGIPINNPARGTPEAALVDAVRASDRLIITRLTSQPGFPKNLNTLDVDWLRDATRRSPLRFNGENYVWEDGNLYELATFRAHADLAALQKLGAHLVADRSQAMCSVDASDLLRLMSGAKIAKTRLQFSEARRIQFFGTAKKPSEQIVVGDIVKFPCGCFFACRDQRESRHILARVEKDVSCVIPNHGNPTVSIPIGDSFKYYCVSTRHARFDLPVWPRRKLLATGEVI